MTALLATLAVPTADDALRVVVAGGGTGGHLYPGIAIGEAICATAPGALVHYIGSTGGIEARVLPREGLPHTLLPSSRLFGGGPVVMARGAGRLVLSLGRAIATLRELRPHVVVGVGGYASGPAVLAAWLLGIPVVVQEQNAVPGVTNKLAGRLAERVFVSFAPAVESFPHGSAVLAGNPIRRGIRDAIAEVHPPVSDGARVLVFGGSQGARFLNERVPGLIARLRSERPTHPIHVLHQTGEADCEATRQRYVALGIEADVRPYLHDMAGAYADADIAICRSGASTIAELLAVGLPAVLVPFPFAAHDHQAANARVLEEAGAAVMTKQEDWDEEALAGRIGALLDDPERLRGMAASARSMARPDAADRIAEAVVGLAEKGRG